MIDTINSIDESNVVLSTKAQKLQELKSDNIKVIDTNQQNILDVQINLNWLKQREQICEKLKNELNLVIPALSLEQIEQLSPEKKQEYFDQETALKTLVNPQELNKFIKETIEEKKEELAKELTQIKSQQGWIGKGWDWFKNKTGLFASSDKAQKALEKLEKGEISLPEAINTVEEYKISQKDGVDTISDIGSGLLAFGAYSLAATLALPSGGASIAIVAGCTAAFATGAGVKCVMKASDAKSGGRKYTDLKKDILIGGAAGLIAPVSSGIGGAIGKNVAMKLGVKCVTASGKELVKHTGKTTLKRTIIDGTKKALLRPTGVMYKDGTLLKRHFSFCAEAAVDGAIGGGIEGGFRAGLDGRNVFKGMMTSAAYCGVFAPVLGTGFKTTASALGKGVKTTAQGSKFILGKTISGGSILYDKLSGLSAKINGIQSVTMQ